MTQTSLIARMIAGDDRALGALYDAYGHVVYGLAHAITGNQSTAESVVADAFAEAWRSASSFDGSQTSVLAWLTSIVRRKALGLRKKGEAGPKLSVGEALRTLTPPQREVIELSYYRGFTVGEIAVQLGAPESGARDLLRSAMQELRSTLSGSTVFEDHVVTRA